MSEELHPERLKHLKEIITTQCNDGNWNFDPYMHGMANGLILGLALIEGKDPEYKDSPDEWLNETRVIRGH